MTRPHATLISSARAAMACALLVAARAPVAALERGPYSMDILVDGRPLAEQAARAHTYVEALPGREYSIRLTNHTGRRVAIALAVDGLNSIDARTTSAQDAAKWILGPYETIVLDGWQTSSSVARRFYFTTEERSYGAWLGETENLGIISAAVFRERVKRERIYQPQAEPRRSAPQPAEGKARDGEAPAAGSEAMAAPVVSDELAATGIGREVDHDVTFVSFDAEPEPAAILEVRYEYRDALVRLGVLPSPCDPGGDPLGRRERARGFAEPGFAPDPYRCGGWR